MNNIKQFILKYFTHQPITFEEVANFLVVYCESINHRIPNTQELNVIYQALQLGVFNLDLPIRKYIATADFQIILILDKQNRIISAFFE
jgi:hypothetical protein